MYDDMRKLIDEREAREENERRTASNDERFSALDAKLDTLVDTVTQFVKGSAPGARPPGDGGGTGGDPASPAGDPPPPIPPVEPPPPELPVEVVTRLPVPRIYTGDDEPAEVKYTDPASGEEKTRKGRQKGHPVSYDVAPYEPPPQD